MLLSDRRADGIITSPVGLHQDRGGREGDTQRILPLPSPPRTFSRTASDPPPPLPPSSFLPSLLLNALFSDTLLRATPSSSGQQHDGRAEGGEGGGRERGGGRRRRRQISPPRLSITRISISDKKPLTAARLPLRRSELSTSPPFLTNFQTRADDRVTHCHALRA